MSEISTIYDVWDNGSLEWVDFSYWQSAPLGDAPAYLWNVLLYPPSPVGAEEVTFTLMFSAVMNTSINPVVTFGIDVPYNRHIITGSWQDSQTWVGTFTIDYFTGDGWNTLAVSSARDADDTLVPTNTYNTFFIETGIGAVQGVAAAVLESAIDITWQANMEPDLAGYYVYYDDDEPNPPFDGTGAWQGSSPIDVGNVTTFRLTNLVNGVTYYMSVRAYDTSGHIGDYSLPVSGTFITPYTPAPTPTPEPQQIPATSVPGLIMIMIAMTLLIILSANRKKQTD